MVVPFFYIEFHILHILCDHSPLWHPLPGYPGVSSADSFPVLDMSTSLASLSLVISGCALGIVGEVGSHWNLSSFSREGCFSPVQMTAASFSLMKS